MAGVVNGGLTRRIFEATLLGREREFAFCLLGLSLLLYLRAPWSPFIFDEQEALLKNPYLAFSDNWFDAFVVDFWGRPPSTTIGSYRPLPNLLWKLLSPLLRFRSPVFFTGLNLLAHVTCGLLLARLILNLWGLGAQEPAANDQLVLARGAAFLFVIHPVVAEAVCSAVGLADILVGMFLLLTLNCVVCTSSATRKIPRLLGFGGVFGLSLLGLWSKESMLGIVCAAPMVAGVISLFLRLGWPRIVVDLFGQLTASASAVVVYVELRKWLYPAQPMEAERLVLDGPGQKLVSSFVRWMAPPLLPADPLNNPLFAAPFDQRVATVFRILGSQLRQVLLPTDLRADYSFPSELPALWTWSGALALICGIIIFFFALVLVFRVRRYQPSAWARGSALLFTVSVLLFFACWLPVSNAVVLLPTIRAERLFYAPFIALVLGGVGLLGQMIMCPVFGARGKSWWLSLALSYGVVLCAYGRLHTNTYGSDLSFWKSNYERTGSSAKAALNYGLMKGTRGDLEARRLLTEEAIERAPSWSMAHVYLGDVLCRQNQLEVARPAYLRGLELDPNSKALSALALQCIWDHGAYPRYRPVLSRIAREGSWLAYLMYELDESGEENRGLPSMYRPQGYNRRLRRRTAN